MNAQPEITVETIRAAIREGQAAIEHLESPEFQAKVRAMREGFEDACEEMNDAIDGAESAMRESYGNGLAVVEWMYEGERDRESGEWSRVHWLRFNGDLQIRWVTRVRLSHKERKRRRSKGTHRVQMQQWISLTHAGRKMRVAAINHFPALIEKLNDQSRGSNRRPQGCR